MTDSAQASTPLTKPQENYSVEEKLDFLISEMQSIQSRQQEILEKLETSKVNDGSTEDFDFFHEEGGAKTREVATIIAKSKSGQGIPVGTVEGILDCSRRHALKAMRTISEEKDNCSFLRGQGNKPSRLKTKKLELE